MYCAMCGKEVREGQRFCGRCGAPIKPPAVDVTDENADAPAQDGAGGVAGDDEPESREATGDVSSSLKTDETCALPLRGKASIPDGSDDDVHAAAEDEYEGKPDAMDETARLAGGGMASEAERDAADGASGGADETERLASRAAAATEPIGGKAAAAGAAPRPSSRVRATQFSADASKTAVMPRTGGSAAGRGPAVDPIGPNGAMVPGGLPSPKRNRNKTIAAAMAAVAAVVIAIAVLFGTQFVSGEQPTVCTLATLVDPVDASGEELEGYEVTLVDRETGKEVSSLSVPSGGGFSIGQFRDAEGNQIPDGKYMLRFKDLKSGNVYDGRHVDISREADNPEREITGKPKPWRDPVSSPVPDPNPPANSSSSEASSKDPAPEPSPDPSPSPSVKKVTVPDVNGLTRSEAEEVLRKEGLGLSADDGAADSVLAGTSPAAGEKVKSPGLVKAMYVNNPTDDEVTVPDVAGKTCEEAGEILDQIGLTLDYGGFDAEDVVIGTTPMAGEKVERGSSVMAECVESSATVEMPDVVGETCVDAEKILAELGLVLNYDPDDVDSVIEETNPAAGEMVEAGSDVFVERVAAKDEGDDDSDESPSRSSGSASSSGSSAGSGAGNGGGAGQGSNAADANDAYLAKVKEYQAKYGNGDAEARGTDEKQLAGLALVELIDFDNDGSDELLLGYYDSSRQASAGSGPKDCAAYQVEVWYHDGRTIQKAYQGSLLGTNVNRAFIRLYDYKDGKLALDTAKYSTDPEHGKYLESETLAFEGGKMTPVFSNAAYGLDGTGPESYEVDGEEVDLNEYNIATRRFSEDHDNYTYNMVGASVGGAETPEGYTVYNPDEILELTADSIKMLSE